MARPKQLDRPSSRGRRRREEVTGSACAFIDEALARLFVPVTTVDPPERIEQIDARLEELADLRGQRSVDLLRQAGVECAKLLVERYELSNGTYLAPVQRLAWAVDAAHRNGTGISPLLRKTGDWPTDFDTIDEVGHSWIRATAAGACLLLVGDHGSTHDEASEAVSNALSKAKYQSRTGAKKLHAGDPIPNHRNKVKLWVRSASAASSKTRIDAQDAICNLVTLVMPLSECRDSVARQHACSSKMLTETVRKTAEAFQVIKPLKI